MINSVGNSLTRETARQTLLARQIEQTQAEISTGKKLRQRSDNPIAFARAETISRAEADAAIWSSNIAATSGRIASADVALETAAIAVSRARETVLHAASAPTSSADRSSLAAALNSAADEIAALVQSKGSDGEPLFPSGKARSIRFGAETVFAAIPSRDDVFSIGGQDLATALKDAAAAVQSSSADRIGGALDALGQWVDHIANQRGMLGLAGARLEGLADIQSEQLLALASEKSALVDTDLGEAIARLNAQNLTLEAAQAAFARINRENLFDLLR